MFSGKSCSIDNLKTIVLGSFKGSLYNRDLNFSFVYTALSSTTIITFSFNKGGNWYLDDVSIFDTLNNVELIRDGGFESGTMYAYCVCDSNFKPTDRNRYHRGVYVCEINGFFSAVKLSQAVDTITGREYNVSFWLQSQSGLDNVVATVYMSSAFRTREYFVSLLLTRFIFIFFVFYVI
jgi:hypothetical protein